MADPSLSERRAVTSPTTTVTRTERPRSLRHWAMYHRAYLAYSEPTKTKK